MTVLENILQELFGVTLKQMVDSVQPLLPKIGTSLLILLVGWIIAVVAKKVVSKILRAFGVDVVSEKVGLMRFLERGGIHARLSNMIGGGFYWVIMLVAFITVLHAVNLKFTQKLTKEIVAYIPNMLGAAVIFIIGLVVAKFAGNFAQTTSRLAGAAFHSVLAKTVRYLITGIAAIMALEQLMVSKEIIILSVIIVFGIMPFIVALVFAMGGRDIVAGLLAGYFLRKRIAAGDKVSFDQVSGEVQDIDSVFTVMAQGDGGEIIVPNSEMAKKVLKKGAHK